MRRPGQPGRGRARRERGVALVIVVVTLAILGAVVNEVSYHSTVDLTSAVAARDELRADYLARSGVNLSRLLIKVQQAVLDKNRDFLGDLQLADFAPYLIAAFGGGEAAGEGLAAFLGLDPSAAGAIRGIGLPGGSFDVQLDSEDGKINVDCAGGAVPTPAQQQTVAAQLAALFAPARYNALFEQADADGQFTDRAEQIRAILDFVDGDTALYEGGAAPEDYGYERLRDRYLARNNRLDTLDELHLVKGVDDDFMAAFGEALTVWGDCKVNLATASAPVLAGIIRHAARNETDLANEANLLRVAAYVVTTRELLGGLSDAATFVTLVKNPTGLGAAPGGPPLVGIDLDPAKVNEFAKSGPRRVYRVEATAEVGKAHKRIVGVFDVKKFNQNATDPGAERQGAWVYWREE